ncbi:MAG: (2Fe-2S)-binding protein [Chloroflexi bacterium]|nr:(2Fe-2S)-binding protein [Chloroflexota bacterium]
MSGKVTRLVLTVDGQKYEVVARPDATLAAVLREDIGLTGTKVMCEGGECGSCTVLIDGNPVLSCLTLAVECQGRYIETIEGLADPISGELHPLQKEFVERSGMQCGICTPGMLMTAKALLAENPDPSEDDVRQALAGNLCRCGNYKRITECVLAAAKTMRGGER